ncbi:MAG: hypothetical protein ACKPKO_63600, partial [Candidatus Fonsibacter sp.]
MYAMLQHWNRRLASLARQLRITKKEHVVAVLLTHQSERRMESLANFLACAPRRWQLSPVHVIPMAAETTMRTVGHISGKKAMS